MSHRNSDMQKFRRLARRGRLCCSALILLSSLPQIANAKANAVTTNRKADEISDAQHYRPEHLNAPMEPNVKYMPVGDGSIAKQAGFYLDKQTGKQKFNESVKFAVKANEKVFCLLDGVAIESGWSKVIGGWVTIFHAYPNLKTKVSNLSTYFVESGERVKRGTVLGLASAKQGPVGFSVRNGKGEAVDPLMFIETVPEYTIAINKFKAKLDAALEAKQQVKEAAEQDSKPETGYRNDWKSPSPIPGVQSKLEDIIRPNRAPEVTSPQLRKTENIAEIDTLLITQKFIDADAAIQRELKLRPTDARLWLQYGSCKESLKDLHTALGAYEMVCQLEPSNTSAPEMAKRLRSMLEKGEQQRKLAIEVEQVRSAQIFDIDFLIAERNESSYKKALEILSEALRSDSTNTKLWLRMGICKHALLDYHSALAAYEMASRLSPGNREADQAVTSMRSYLAGTTLIPPQIPTIAVIDYGLYMADLQRRIKRCWFAANQANASTRVQFKISQVGSMSALQVIRSSDSLEFDNLAKTTIQNAAPFRPLPFGAPAFVTITACFNETDRQKSDISGLSIYINSPPYEKLGRSKTRQRK